MTLHFTNIFVKPFRLASDNLFIAVRELMAAKGEKSIRTNYYWWIKG